MLQTITRSIFTSTARLVTRTPTPSTSFLRSFSQLSITRPSLPTPPLRLLEQTRTFKMPSCMKKKTSPLSRSAGAGKTAKKHSARRAKRRRQRAKKIN